MHRLSGKGNGSSAKIDAELSTDGMCLRAQPCSLFIWSWWCKGTLHRECQFTVQAIWMVGALAATGKQTYTRAGLRFPHSSVLRQS